MVADFLLSRKKSGGGGQYPYRPYRVTDRLLLLPFGYLVGVTCPRAWSSRLL
jgi:hypothetical protein